MREVEVAVECHVETAVVTVRGRWRVHCVMGSRSCDCWFLVPTGEQGSILGLEVDVDGTSYSTQVDGGSSLSLKVSWLQKLVYKDGNFTINVPFHFPDYVNPSAKIFSKREKVQLNVNTSIGKEVVIQRTSHALKEEHRNVGTMSFLYDAVVDHWSTKDFHFSYSVYSSDMFGSILLQSPSVHDYDQRKGFYLYLFPGNNPSRMVFRKEVVFLVDISGSMEGKPLENVKNALSSALLELSSSDKFNIIAFNEETHPFSSSLELATEEMIGDATQWISKSFVAAGGTNILRPLNEAMEQLSEYHESLPHIFLVTDGSVEGERDICCAMRDYVTNKGPMAPRICTFGIGTYCNHYFLQMLSSIGRGQYEAAYDRDIKVDMLDHLEIIEVYPSDIPDLSLGCPLVISGRYEGRFPDSAKVKGTLADMSVIVIDLKVKNVKDTPLDKVVAKQQIDVLSSQAWFYESKQLEEKVIKRSIQSGMPSEYTDMILVQHEMEKQHGIKQSKKHKHKKNKTKDPPIILVHRMKLGFGNIAATAQNLPTGFRELKPQEAFDVLDTAAGCCSKLCDICCCMCFIRMCSKLNNQCAIATTQLCMALSCLACFECCSLCCGSSND
ncbi:uncharacterized protein A4U43_C07F36540 [Asparagus officinalis]|uniref:VWFA domain-containing protein n=1 Tax=Asparagus officinalis TaxID=4686 RepID=A0A5P1EI09_ASPOF|nr:uncharacterized protein A4U43_C07F36540 [Asparagus officinalis]